MRAIGLDIGGANLKASDGQQQTVTQPFALWRDPEGLAGQLLQVIDRFPDCRQLAITMTGELADCFRTRAEGVRRILDAALVAAGDREVIVWATAGEFIAPEDAADFPELVASGNWHALATWAGRMTPHGTGLLIDIGSTTSDLIPLEEGCPLPCGRTDLERLQSGELVYLGVRRTPLCGLVTEIEFRGKPCNVARELFATTYDVHLWLGHLPEDPTDNATANGRPATREAAGARLARMLCSDQDDLSGADLTQLAQRFFDAEVHWLGKGLDQVLARTPHPGQILLTGEGEFLARAILQQRQEEHSSELISLATALGPAHSQGACALALARLANERWNDSI